MFDHVIAGTELHKIDTIHVLKSTYDALNVMSFLLIDNIFGW
jgi:hypothetical protein